MSKQQIPGQSLVPTPPPPSFPIGLLFVLSKDHALVVHLLPPVGGRPENLGLFSFT